MTNAKDSVAQAKLLAELFTKRAGKLEELAQLDEAIQKAEKGELNGYKSNGHGNGHATEKKAPVAQKPAPQPQTGEKKRGPGRPKGSKNKTKEESAPAPAPAPVVTENHEEEGKRFKNVDPKTGKRLSLRELIVKICARHPSGIKLADLVEKVLSTGYRSTSDAKGFEQNIRTNLHNLMNKQIIVKDADKKYHFQPPKPEQDESEVAETAEVATA